MSYYAQFYVDDSNYYKIQLSDIKYKLDGTTLLITRYDNTKETVVQIPPTYNYGGVEYTTLGILGVDESDDSVTGFRNSNVELVDIPEGISQIGARSFEASPTLSSVRIGKDVNQFGERAFANCTALDEVYYDAENALNTSNSQTFDGCGKTNHGIKVIVGPNAQIIPTYLFHQSSNSVNDAAVDCLDLSNASSCTRINTSAFNNTNIRQIIFGDALKEIGQAAFSTNYLIKELTLPEGVVTLSTAAFESWRNLTKIVIPSSLNTLTGAFRHCPNLTEFDVHPNSKFEVRSGNLVDKQTNTIIIGVAQPSEDDDIVSIAPYAYAGRESLTTIELPDNITLLETETFAGCSNLRTVDLNEGLETIGNSAFVNCKSLESIAPPSTLTTINNNAFNTSGLTSITIPANVRVVGHTAFLQCKQLESVVIESSTPNLLVANLTSGLDCEPFRLCTNLSTITVGWSKSEDINKYAPWGATCTNGVKVTYSDGEETYNV